MPTYVYACDSCGAQFEQFQSFKDEPLRTCPSCACAVRRVFQPVGIVFKGAGWYITDSRKSGSATVSSEEPKVDKTEASGGDVKSETKTEKSAPASTSEPAASTTTSGASTSTTT